MKKIKLYIPAIRKEYFEFYVFDFSLKNNTKSQIALKFLYFFGYTLIFLTLFLFPISNLIYSGVDSETAVLKFLLLVIPISVGIYLSTILLNGKRRLMDPPFFLASLLFALGITTASVLTTSPSLSNTFGVVGLRNFAGISIILFISTYYISGVYIHNRELFRRAFKFLIAGIYLYFLLNLFTLSSIAGFESVTLMIAALGGIFVLTKSSSNLKSVKVTLAFVLIIIAYFGYNNNQLSLDTVNYILISGVVAFIVVLLTLFLSKKTLVKVISNESKIIFAEIVYQKKLRLMPFFKYIFDWILILSPIILIIIVVVFNRQNPVIFEDLKTQFANNLKAFNSIADFTKNIDLSQLGTFLFGIGSTNLLLTNSFLQNLIISQGFLGLASYLFLWTYGIIVAARFVYSNFRNGGNYMIPSFLLFIMTFIFGESFFFNLSLKLMFLWWIAFSFVSIKYNFLNKLNISRFKDEDFVIQDFKIGERKMSRFAKYIIVILIILAAVYISFNFISIIIK